MKKERLFHFAVFLLLLLAEVYIALYVHDSFVRPYLGDVLVVVVLYFFLRIFIPKDHIWLLGAIFLFAVLVEILQYFHLAELLGITNPVLRILLGSVFDVKDILCYGVGCCFLAVYEWLRYVKQQKRK